MAHILGISNVAAGLSPEEKLQKIHAARTSAGQSNQNRTGVIMVGHTARQLIEVMARCIMWVNLLVARPVAGSRRSISQQAIASGCAKHVHALLSGYTQHGNVDDNLRSTGK